MSPFDFLNAINNTKEDLIVDAETEKKYSAFMVNRGLSYFPDTVLMANEMNMAPNLDNKMQFDFLRLLVRKRKRFSKWTKATPIDAVDAVKEMYGYSEEKARQALTLLTPDQVEIIKNKMAKGGRLGKR